MTIQVSIQAGNDKETSKVTATGSMQHIITDRERETFGLNDDALKNAVKIYYGEEPTDAYLHSPTPWDDLYKRYGWPQVQTVLSVKSATITEITSKPTIIATKKFENKSKNRATFNAGITYEVSETSTSTWTQSNSVSFEQSIDYGITFLGAGGGGSTTLSYTHEWGREDSESETITIGSESGVTVELGDGDSVEVQLNASHGTMKVMIEYEASLTGYTAVNYEDKHNGHHFWGINIENMMRAANIPTTIIITEEILLDYYDYSEINLVDSTSNQIASFALPHPILK
ncbi:hypothetical protein NQ117_01920 [Paenibacillus sp. SC116]|uniref:hypothetical protein n=1 Tax=Paenibacillus sp. SC116 TaxID=2968986 RepID=UPI00215AB2A0|nr:hypothetical protein [Paenibacillus sp. SC116]MCR8842431.1 hypothetical protein [Paenibacillus sp. SC116]